MFVEVRLLDSRTMYINTDCIVSVIPRRREIIMANGDELKIKWDSWRSFCQSVRELGIEVD